MYKQKLAVFAGIMLFLVVITSVLIVVSSHITRSNLIQNRIAQSLLTEHLIVSSTSYRLFKQLTDELIFGQDANQAKVRNKRAIIEQSFTKIIELEAKQRDALGEEATSGSIEDTSALTALLDEIIAEYGVIISQADGTQLAQQQRVQHLLEVTIDNRFREAINAAVVRQSKVVASLNARIETFNQSIFWYSILLAIFSVPMVVFGSYWLLNILYQPLNSIRLGAEAISQGNYQHRISRGFDAEFDAIAASFNSMADELSTQRNLTEQAKRELSFQVSQRTAELTEANSLLQNNDKARREFLADISHELRTPLSIIRGEVQVTMRQQSIKEEDYRSTLQAVLDQSLNLSHLVDDLLLIARTESGKLRLIPQMVEVAPFIAASINKIDSLLERKHIRLYQDVQTDLPLVEIDPERIAQVLMILLDNAITYTQLGKQITLQCKCESSMLRIDIADEGEGIAEDALPFVFDRYFRSADSRTGQGSGLGLAIAKAIVVAHGGSITVESTLGHGSTFTITLPVISNK